MKTQTELSRNGIVSAGTKIEPISETTEDFQFVREIVRGLIQSQSFNTKTGSYKLKHVVEDVLKIVSDGEHTYVPNGALIRAMELESFRWKRQAENSLNAWFNVSERSIENLKQKYAI